MLSVAQSNSSGRSIWTVTKLPQGLYKSQYFFYNKFIQTHSTAMTTDTTFQFSRNQELLEEVSQFQSQVLNFMMGMSISDDKELIQDEIDCYKVYDV